MSVSLPLQVLANCTRGRRLGLICGPASWLPGEGNIEDYLLREADVRGFLALEHGLRGELQDGVLFDSYQDRSGRPVYSFYGGSRTFPEDFLRRVDAVVVHVQDVSHRAYTYQWTLADTLALAARTGTTVFVLDRPTPLGHLGTQGPSGTQFFPLPFPVLPALTLGELGLWLKQQQRLSVDLHVLPVTGWRREMTWEETGLPWIPPSPNIPQPLSAYAYACTGIIQATSVSEGRGTCKPFEYIGAPFVNAQQLARELNAASLPGLVFREVYFKPGFNKFAGQVCGGVHLMLSDARALEPMRTMMTVLQTLARLHPGAFTLTPGFGDWLDNDYTWTPERLAALNIAAWLAEATDTAARFRAAAAGACLY